MVSAEQESRVSTAAVEGSREPPERSRRGEDGFSPAISVLVTLLTGGDDRPYALGMASALVGQGISVDSLGSDKLNAPDLRRAPLITFLNLLGNQTEDDPFDRKFVRLLSYYTRLAKYVVRSEPRIFHVLWNSTFEHFD
jgi:hypothetical protein